jgi:hypothetical protein
MSGAQGLQQWRSAICGKVPYRLLGGLRSVKRPRPSQCRPDTMRHPTRLYKQKSFEPPLAGIAACLRKRKKEGLKLRVETARLGCTGPKSAALRASAQEAG